MDKHAPIAIYFEHPDWFRALFAELDRRALPYVRLDARSHSYDVGAAADQFGLFFNRMSASAYLRGNGRSIFFTHDYLAHLERNGTRVINGAQAFAYEISKAAQLSLLRSLGLSCPRSRVINCVEEASKAAEALGFPVIIKPNIGGRGAGIVRLNSAAELERALASSQIDLGIDSTALVQEFIPARGGHISRVETLGGKFLYALKIYPSEENFNLCPAEVCLTENMPSAATEICLIDAPKKGLRIEGFQPPAEIIETVERIVREAKIDVGGVEY
ncbi:MAG TPA: hypothetical protein VGP40_03020, partial [Chthoniobacterales bacterium]|nr:hypothetical protein [Chthoniobacterales bacterium]